MKFDWEFDVKAKKSFDKLDTPVKLRIVKWLNTNIKDCENPRLFGQALEGHLENFWRYRVGKYRILADIQDGMFTVLVVKVDKRSDVYK